MTNNDFFGIEQVSSIQNTKNEEKEVKSKHSGSEYIDDYFFPDLSEKQKNLSSLKDETVDKVNNISGTDFIDDQFFGEYKSKQMLQSSTNIPEIEDYNSVNIFSKTEKYSKLQMIDEPAIQFHGVTGKDKILDMIIPVWKFRNEDLIKLMSERVVFDSDDLIIFDKPYQMSYSSASKDQPQMDRLLQDLKKIVAPQVDRLHLIKSLDKGCSGLVLFAKSVDAQKKYKEMIKNGKVDFEYRTIVKNVPENDEACINIPLYKFVAGQDFEMRPLFKSTKSKVNYVKTNYSVITNNNKAHCAYLRVNVNNEIPHQIRSHLAYGIGCPIIGDKKYNRIGKNAVQNLSDRILSNLEINKNQAKKLPMLLHLNEVYIDGIKTRNKFDASIIAPLPEYFKFIQRRLALLKK